MLELLDHVLPAPQNAHVRAEELVGRAEQEVAAEILHVDQPVRRELHGVDIDQRTSLFRQRRQRFHPVDGACQCPGVL